MYILLGAPGGGKTTQARLLVERQSFCLIPIGELLRQQASPEILANMTQGGLVDYQYVNQLLDRAISDQLAADPQSRILIDGFPRAVEQAEWLIERWGSQLRLVWVLDLDPAVVNQRLESRGRLDDQATTINQRWQVYQTDTPRALAALREAGVPVIVVNADQSIEAVHQQMVQELADD